MVSLTSAAMSGPGCGELAADGLNLGVCVCIHQVRHPRGIALRVVALVDHLMGLAAEFSFSPLPLGNGASNLTLSAYTHSWRFPGHPYSTVQRNEIRFHKEIMGHIPIQVSAKITPPFCDCKTPDKVAHFPRKFYNHLRLGKPLLHAYI